jgi:hypothetical protein
MKFHNLELQTDIEGRLKDLPEYVLGKDIIDNDGETSYYLDVNDIGYSYVNESDRDRDFDKLVKYIFKEDKKDELPDNQG